MSTPTLKKNYYLLRAPDLPNAQRAKHNAEHMAYWGPLMQSGGPIGASDPCLSAFPHPCYMRVLGPLSL